MFNAFHVTNNEYNVYIYSLFVFLYLRDKMTLFESMW